MAYQTGQFSWRTIAKCSFHFVCEYLSIVNCIFEGREQLEIYLLVVRDFLQLCHSLFSIFHFRILIKLASSCSTHSPALSLPLSPSRSPACCLWYSIIKLPAEELLCRAQACSVLEDLFELVDSSTRRNGSSKCSTNCLFTWNYAKFCKLEKEFCEKWRRLWVMKWVTVTGPQRHQGLYAICPSAVPNPASVAFLILLHVRCISNAILLCSPSLSLSFPLSLCSGLLFALRKLKRNYYNLYYLQLSCPSELAQLPRPYPPSSSPVAQCKSFVSPWPRSHSSCSG